MLAWEDLFELLEGLGKEFTVLFDVVKLVFEEVDKLSKPASVEYLIVCKGTVVGIVMIICKVLVVVRHILRGFDFVVFRFAVLNFVSAEILN